MTPIATASRPDPSLSAGLLDLLDYSFATPGVHDVIWFTRTSTAPSQCPFPVVSRGFREVDPGTFNVGPAPPLLTTKAQCRNGGWQSYGIFANQRECIEYVREQARKACYFELVAHGRPAFRTKYGIGPQKVLAMWSCVHRRTGF